MLSIIITILMMSKTQNFSLRFLKGTVLTLNFNVYLEFCKEIQKQHYSYILMIREHKVFSNLECQEVCMREDLELKLERDVGFGYRWESVSKDINVKVGTCWASMANGYNGRQWQMGSGYIW